MFTDLINLMLKTKNSNKYTYSLYCDIDALGDVLLIPVFHTIYLACRKNNVIISDPKDLWIITSFPNNNFYYLLNHNMDNKSEEINNYPIKTIVSLKEIT